GILSGLSTMARQIVPALFLVLVIAGGTGAARADYSAIVLDATNGNILYQRNADTKRYPASLAKMMTLYLAFEQLQNGTVTMDTEWTASARAQAQPPTEVGLRAGDTIKVRDAIMALITKSANDVATVVAEGIGGTEWQFAQMMTAKARELGMRNTVFANASGLPDNSMVSTARDISILSLRLQSDFPQLYPLFATRSFTYRGNTYGNHNKLLGVVDGVDGIKTGFTNAAGWNLAASAIRDGRRIVAVVMGGQSRIWRDNRMKELLGEGFIVAVELDTPAPIPGVHPTRGDGIVAVAAVDPALPLPDARPADTVVALGEYDNAAQDPQGGFVTAQGSVEDLPWAVQVGAFSQFANAYRALDEAELVLNPIFGGKGTSVVTAAENDGATLYRARFVNLSESQAREGCRVLAARNLSCAVVRYSAGS
ncbi:MAG: D-alanyl-D-alanine carboxypeptidase, partial [Proteobacteria bacterium]|nr:D-alanyl-D-alanine carboxypeptidase [Pseudomonadota bacterium]